MEDNGREAKAMKALKKFAARICRGFMEQRIYTSELESLAVVLSHAFDREADGFFSGRCLVLLLIHSSDAMILRLMMLLHLLPKAVIVVIDNGEDLQHFIENDARGNQCVLIQRSLYFRFYTRILMCQSDNSLMVV